MPAGEGSPIVERYNYVTGEYMRPSYYGERSVNFSGLDQQINNRNTRMNRQGYAPVPNYMVGTGNSPMSAGGNNLMPSPQKGFQYLTSGGYPPPSAMPQNSNVYPAMYNHQTGQRQDPQKFGAGLVPYAPKGHVDKHSSPMILDQPAFAGASYLSGSNLQYRDVAGSGGYKYRQYPDGSIQILQSPQGGIGTIVQKNSPFWNAITKEIGQYPQTKAGQVTQQAQSYLDANPNVKTGIQTLFDSFVGSQKSKQQQQILDQARSKAQSDALSKKSPLQKATPYLIGLGAIALVTTVLVSVRK
jgi:hypothetical protein